MTFSAASPSVTTPAAQTFTVSFGKDVVQLAVVHSGDAIASTSSVQSGRSATITVTPATPANIGPGPFQGAVAVTGYTCANTTCSQLAAGSSATVLVNYQVSPVITSVSPYVATSGVSDTVIVRGVGFRAFSNLTARFNDTAATALVISTDGTLLNIQHPALPAGDYTVHLDATNHTGEIPSSVVLRVRDPVAYAATTLDYPASTTAVRSLFYDAERQALFAVTDTAPSNPIVRYQYANGAWAAPTQAANGFLDAALSADGTKLFALTSNTIVPVDPVTLALGTAVTAPSLATNSALKNIVVGFDNRALITTSLPTSGATALYLYDPVAATATASSTALNNGTPTMSANLTDAIISQGDPTLTADVSVFRYTVTSNQVAATTVSLRQNTIPPAVSRNSSRIALNGLRIYDGNFVLLGTLPSTTTALVFKPDGSRLYAYDSTAGGILIYDTSVDKDEAAYTPVGAVTPLPADPGGTAVRMTLTPDGGTLFLAGSSRIVVMPTPAG